MARARLVGRGSTGGSTAPTRRDRPQAGLRCGRGGEEGAALVEFSLIAIVLFTLLFGIIDFGWAFNDWISVRQGARDGVRQAVTGRIGDASCPSDVAAGSPALPNDSVEALVCLTKDRVGLSPAGNVRVNLDIEDTYAAKKSMSVCVMFPLDSISGFFGPILDDIVVHTEVQMKIEQTVDEADNGAADASAPPLLDWAEASLPGNPWPSSCGAENTDP